MCIIQYSTVLYYYKWCPASCVPLTCSPTFLVCTVWYCTVLQSNVLLYTLLLHLIITLTIRYGTKLYRMGLYYDIYYSLSCTYYLNLTIPDIHMVWYGTQLCTDFVWLYIVSYHTQGMIWYCLPYIMQNCAIQYS